LSQTGTKEQCLTPLSVPVQGINNFATGRQPKPSSNGPADRQEPSPKGPAEGIDGKRTHADIAGATRRKDKEEKEKKGPLLNMPGP
jgi:hypothetical protein